MDERGWQLYLSMSSSLAIRGNLLLLGEQHGV